MARKLEAPPAQRAQADLLPQAVPEAAFLERAAKAAVGPARRWGEAAAAALPDPVVRFPERAAKVAVGPARR